MAGRCPDVCQLAFCSASAIPASVAASALCPNARAAGADTAVVLVAAVAADAVAGLFEGGR